MSYVVQNISFNQLSASEPAVQKQESERRNQKPFLTFDLLITDHSSLIQNKLLMPLRNINFSQSFLHQFLPKLLLHVIFSMHNKSLFHRIYFLAIQEMQQVFIIAMRTHTSHNANLSHYAVLLAEDPHLFFAPHQKSA